MRHATDLIDNQEQTVWFLPARQTFLDKELGDALSTETAVIRYITFTIGGLGVSAMIIAGVSIG